MGRHDGGVFNEADTISNIIGLHHFGASLNGFKPGELIEATDGKLYGTTVFGGPSGNGTIYSVRAHGVGYTKLHEFNDAQGYEPRGKLLEASDGKLYGALAWGGTVGGGALYRIDKNGSNFQIIYDFSGLAQGYSPMGNLIEDGSGFLYGSTNYSSTGNGVVFKINKDGTGYTVLRNFSSPDIGYPYGGLQLHMGFLYGTGYLGGSAGLGGVFKIATDGTGYQLLHSFSGPPDGSNSYFPPIIANDGKLYGGTIFGGNDGAGVLYSMNLDGSNYTVIKHLSSSDVQYLQHGIIQGADGLLYGGGYQTSGTGIFQSNLTGSSYNIVKSFDIETEGQTVTSFFQLTGASLPVILTKFQVQKKHDKSLLNWQTAEEENSKSFQIERSVDGTIFTTIGSVMARGNSSHLTSYQFIDEIPLAGMNYYRLKQVDKDARFTYSPVRTLFFNRGGKVILYPNPAVDLIQLQLPKTFSNASLDIINAEGRVMKKMTITNTDQIEIPVTHLPVGRYMVRIYFNNEVTTVSFIKARAR
jgi:uncharacterized repeat protein (TIGR03803 family)